MHHGDIFLPYLIWYPVGRFWVEMFPPDACLIGTLAKAQWFALAHIALGMTHSKRRRCEWVWIASPRCHLSAFCCIIRGEFGHATAGSRVQQ
jgi:hypothetical protein